MSISTANPGPVEGPFLAGLLACCPLYGITCAQTVYYFRTYSRQDPILLKLLVIFLLLLETAHFMLLAQAAFFIYIFCKVPENTPQAFEITLGFAASFMITIIITSVVQSFYSWRIWTLSSTYKWRALLVTLIVTASLTQCGLGLATAAFFSVHAQITSARGQLQRRVYSANLATSMLCDALITISLVYCLNRMRSGLRSTENVVNRLILYSVNVGLVTSIVALCTLISYSVTPSSNFLFTLFLETNSKFYVNSMLVTLNSRNRVREILDAPTTGISFPRMFATRSTNP